jgi:hypothetical protein
MDVHVCVTMSLLRTSFQNAFWNDLHVEAFSEKNEEK